MQEDNSLFFEDKEGDEDVDSELGLEDELETQQGVTASRIQPNRPNERKSVWKDPADEDTVIEIAKVSRLR